MDQRAREEIAAALLGAYDSGKPIDPPTERHPDLAADDAYEIQLLQVSRWTAAGARVAGHKVGLTSAAMQRQMGVHQPDYGHLLDRMFWLEYEPVPVSRFLGGRGMAIEPGWIVLAGGMTEAVTVPAGRPLAAHFTSLGSVFLP